MKVKIFKTYVKHRNSLMAFFRNRWTGNVNRKADPGTGMEQKRVAVKYTRMGWYYSDNGDKSMLN